MKLNDHWKIDYFDVGRAKDLEVASPDYLDYLWMTAKVPGGCALYVSGSTSD